MGGLPVIDIAPLMETDERGKASAAGALGKACHDIGFMVIRGHGIAPATVARLREAVVRFFEQPLEDKLAWSITRDNYRGYIPLGFFTPNAAGEADRYEGYKLHWEVNAADPIRAACDLYGPNKWPDKPSALRAAALDYWRQCDRVAGVLLDALALALGIDPDVFRRAFAQPLTNMTLLHYPPRTPDHHGVGIHPHKDTDALTILAPDPVGGLYVKRKGLDEWIAADAPEDALIVNIGDLLEVWSGGYFVSTPHKVVNSSGHERYSFPYFAVPRFDVVVAPLAAAQPGFAREEIPVGAVSRQVWQSNWPDAAPIDARYDPATP